MELQRVIGDNIKGVRERKKLTLDAAAKQTGVSRSMLAQIERGDVNPTISVLWKIANGYKVSFTSLLDEPREAPLLILDHVLCIVDYQPDGMSARIFEQYEESPVSFGMLRLQK